MVSWADDLAVLIKPNLVWAHNPAILLIATYPNDLKTCVHTKTCMRMLIAALFRIAKHWEQPRCPSLGRWTDYGVATQQSITQWRKRNEASSHGKTRKNLKYLLLSDRSQSAKAICCGSTIIRHPRKRTTRESNMLSGGHESRGERMVVEMCKNYQSAYPL